MYVCSLDLRLYIHYTTAGKCSSTFMVGSGKYLARAPLSPFPLLARAHTVLSLSKALLVNTLTGYNENEADTWSPLQCVHVLLRRPLN
jgi:hypothetical protein